jgi:hypothetical protein
MENSRYIVQSFKTGVPIRFDNPTENFLKVLLPPRTYDDAVNVSKYKDNKFVCSYDLLRGSIIGIDISDYTKNTYIYKVANKTGRIAGERMRKNPNKPVRINLKRDLYVSGHHSIVKKTNFEILYGVAKELGHKHTMVFRIKDRSFLFVNTNEHKSKLPIRLIEETIKALVISAYPNTIRLRNE